ncbi:MULTISPECIES: hypothetical protein [Campylobacter]|uniref:hypothetical protein n=1 Tax=Campylobacter TaxID=194 RepID=UPI000A338443|nr:MULTISPECIES: hypothetical protein [unclassified Campylobacter]MCR8678952.1 hypothetical protein [Campylobacter sp. RM19072]
MRLFILFIADILMASQTIGTNEHIAFSILLLLIIILIVINRRPVKNRNQKLIYTQNKNLAKLNLVFFQNKVENGDIIKRLGLFFKVLHAKAAQNNNSIIFNYSPRQARYFSANFKAITNITHNLICFVNKSVSNSSILLSIKPTKTKDEYQISIKTSANINSNEIQTALDDNNKNINYKYLHIASNYANLIGSKIEFSSKPNSSIFSFNITMHKLNNPLNIKSVMQKNALIAYESQTEFFTLVAELSVYGISTQPNPSWESVKNHIIDMLYKPDFLFIQAKIVKNLPYSEINLIKEWQKIKKFKIITISDNSNYDKIASSLDDATLHQPYTADELFEIIKYPPLLHLQTHKIHILPTNDL